MTEFDDRLLEDLPRRRSASRFRPAVLLAVPLAAILIQVYVPLFSQYLTFLELPLLVTVYMALMWRSPVAGMLMGAAIGLMQDSLSHQPIGMFGIVKTLVGYFAASVSLRFDVDHTIIRITLAFFFFFFHQFFYWVLVRALLGQDMAFDTQQTLISGALNAVIAWPLFHVLDRLKVSA